MAWTIGSGRLRINASTSLFLAFVTTDIGGAGRSSGNAIKHLPALIMNPWTDICIGYYYAYIVYSIS